MLRRTKSKIVVAYGQYEPIALLGLSTEGGFGSLTSSSAVPPSPCSPWQLAHFCS